MLLGLENKRPEACFIASFMYVCMCVCVRVRDSLAGEQYDYITPSFKSLGSV